MLRLSVVTPERPFLEVECLSVTVPGLMGQMQVLPGHASLLSELTAGILVYEKANKEIGRFMIGEGFIEIERDEVNVLCEQARFKDEVDKGFEERLLGELSGEAGKDDDELIRQDIEIKRCVARLDLFE
jgi:F-type H+-transporting ATPase subunit epsilon